jgi:hypothetical protein
LIRLLSRLVVEGGKLGLDNLMVWVFWGFLPLEYSRLSGSRFVKYTHVRMWSCFGFAAMLLITKLIPGSHLDTLEFLF